MERTVAEERAATEAVLKFHYSDDGKQWKASAVVTGTSFGARRMQAGFVKPSADCPMD